MASRLQQLLRRASVLRQDGLYLPFSSASRPIGHGLEQRGLWFQNCTLWRPYHTQLEQQRRSTSMTDMALYMATLGMVFFGGAFAMVPLYKVICAATGYGGAVKIGKSVEDKLRQRLESPDEKVERAAAQREITVYFDATVADDMPWRFVPTQDSVRVRPGQSTLAFFTATNNSDKPVTGYSLYNVTPDKAAFYFNKIQCFCFEEQRLQPRETVDMPVFFYIDPEMATDWNCRHMDKITLSYTFRKVEEDEDMEETAPAGPTVVKLHGSMPIPQAVLADAKQQ